MPRRSARASSTFSCDIAYAVSREPRRCFPCEAALPLLVRSQLLRQAGGFEGLGLARVIARYRVDLAIRSQLADDARPRSTSTPLSTSRPVHRITATTASPARRSPALSPRIVGRKRSRILGEGRLRSAIRDRDRRIESRTVGPSRPASRSSTSRICQSAHRTSRVERLETTAARSPRSPATSPAQYLAEMYALPMRSVRSARATGRPAGLPGRRLPLGYQLGGKSSLRRHLAAILEAGPSASNRGAMRPRRDPSRGAAFP